MSAFNANRLNHIRFIIVTFRLRNHSSANCTYLVFGTSYRFIRILTCHSLNEILVLDYIIASENRHLNNFGLICNVNSPEWIDASPIFNSGSSLCFDTITNRIATKPNINCKPFKKSHDDQIQLVSSFEWINFSRLNDIEDNITEILGQDEYYIDDDKRNSIVGLVKECINN